LKIRCLRAATEPSWTATYRIKAARKLGSWLGGDTTGIPVFLCDEWTEAQVTAFRLMVNRSVTWAARDDEVLALEARAAAQAGENENDCTSRKTTRGFEQSVDASVKVIRWRP